MNRPLRSVAFVAAGFLAAACTSQATVAGDGGPHDGGIFDAGRDAGADAGADAGPGDAGPVPKGARVLSLDILATTPASSFQNNLATARAMGVTALTFPYDWNQIEPDTPLTCDAGSTYLDPLGAFASFEALLPDSGLALTLTLRVINTNALDVPSSLQSRAFDGVTGDTELVSCRFERLLDDVFAQIPDVPLASLQIGNEIDSYAGATSATFWSSYRDFFAEVAAYAHFKRPGLRVGVTSTFGGLTGLGPPLAQAGLAQINQLGDLAGVTYYPIDSSYQVRPPSVVAGDVAAMIANLPSGVPLYVEEAGYPSDPGCMSSQAAQAAFIDGLFSAWDANADRLPLVNIVRLDDLSAADAQTAASAYFAQPPAAFVAMLESLGLEQYDGGTKPALSELQRQTSARGW